MYLFGKHWLSTPKPTSSPPPPTAAPVEKPTVAIVKGDDLHEMTRNVINSVGGMSCIVTPGDKVFIKPNFAALGGWSEEHNTITNGQCTKPEIVLATAEECLKAGASQVIIGEAGQGMLPNGEVNRWKYAATLDGTTNIFTEVTRLNEAYGNKVSLEWLSTSQDVWKLVPSRTEFGQIAVSSVVLDADKVISIPVLKTHHSCAVTLSLKNFMGVTPVSLYGSPRLKLHECNLGVEQCFLDVVKRRQTRFSDHRRIDWSGRKCTGGAAGEDCKCQRQNRLLAVDREHRSGGCRVRRHQNHRTRAAIR